MKLINNDTYSKMRKIISERNKIVHPGQKGISYVDKKKKDEAILLLEQAKECLLKVRDTAKGRKANESRRRG